MKHRQIALVLSLAGMPWLVACGGSPRPAGLPPSPVDAGAAAVGTAAPKADESPPPPTQKTAADHHRDFLGGCAKRAMSSPGYCECAWDEYRKLFTDEEMNASELSEAKLEKVKTQVTDACSSKIPENVPRDAFMKVCAKDPVAEKYCGCAWKELRKSASPTEIEQGTFDQNKAFVKVEKVCGKLRPAAAASP